MTREDGTNKEGYLCLSIEGAERKSKRIMKENKSTMRKTIGWASVAYGVFTAISVLGPILLERYWSRRR
jgi:hypothetical protein